MKLLRALEYLDEMISDPRFDEGKIVIKRDASGKLSGYVKTDRIEVRCAGESLLALLFAMGEQAQRVMD